jgi:hypothetical protein
MLSTQTDPIGLLAMTQQHHADLLAEVRHDQLVDAAVQYCAARTVRPENMSRGRFAPIAAVVSGTLGRRLRLASFAQPAGRGA